LLRPIEPAQSWRNAGIAENKVVTIALIYVIILQTIMRPSINPSITLARRSKINPENGCLEWLGARIQGGYGQLGYKRQHLLTHRIAWELIHGDIPEGLDVCHHCDNPCCIDVNHLFLGTRKENAQDALKKGRLKPSIDNLQRHTQPHTEETKLRMSIVHRLRRILCHH